MNILSARVHWLFLFSHYSFVFLPSSSAPSTSEQPRCLNLSSQEKSLLIVVKAESFPSDNKTLSTLRMSSASLVSYWVALVCMRLEMFFFIEGEIKKLSSSTRAKDFPWIMTAIFRRSAGGFLYSSHQIVDSKWFYDFPVDVGISVIRSQFERTELVKMCSTAKWRNKDFVSFVMIRQFFILWHIVKKAPTSGRVSCNLFYPTNIVVVLHFVVSKIHETSIWKEIY